MDPERRLKDALHTMFHTYWINSLRAAVLLGKPEVLGRPV